MTTILRTNCSLDLLFFRVHGKADLQRAVIVLRQTQHDRAIAQSMQAWPRSP
jgi:hypothetical protein